MLSDKKKMKLKSVFDDELSSDLFQQSLQAPNLLHDGCTLCWTAVLLPVTKEKNIRDQEVFCLLQTSAGRAQNAKKKSAEFLVCLNTFTLSNPRLFCLNMHWGKPQIIHSRSCYSI